MQILWYYVIAVCGFVVGYFARGLLERAVEQEPYACVLCGGFCGPWATPTRMASGNYVCEACCERYDMSNPSCPNQEAVTEL